jgi:hypothetical protein
MTTRPPAISRGFSITDKAVSSLCFSRQRQAKSACPPVNWSIRQTGFSYQNVDQRLSRPVLPLMPSSPQSIGISFSILKLRSDPPVPLEEHPQYQGSGWEHLLDRYDESLSLFIDLLWKENHDDISA